MLEARFVPPPVCVPSDSVQVLTFDFHNTLANCDPWFDLEVRELPWAVLDHLGIVPPELEKTGVDRAYRRLRLDVIATGNEIDAYDAVWRICADLAIEVDLASIRDAVDELMRRSVLALEPTPGAAETVRHLHARGVRLGVISSAVHQLSVDWMLQGMGIADCFETVVTSASCGFYKSTAAIYDAALDLLGGDAAASVHVGDSLRWDVATAQQAGMTGVWLRTARLDTFTADGPASVPALTLPTMVGAGPVLVDLLAIIRGNADG